MGGVGGQCAPRAAASNTPNPTSRPPNKRSIQWRTALVRDDLDSCVLVAPLGFVEDGSRLLPVVIATLAARQSAGQIYWPGCAR